MIIDALLSDCELEKVEALPEELEVRWSFGGFFLEVGEASNNDSFTHGKGVHAEVLRGVQQGYTSQVPYHQLEAVPVVRILATQNFHL